MTFAAFADAANKVIARIAEAMRRRLSMIFSPLLAAGSTATMPTGEQKGCQLFVIFVTVGFGGSPEPKGRVRQPS
ncbi:MAG: hypothetical protein JOZ54_02615 [Acidobacteria bacterium]|nr:hypothetical protein [Acidobacteriota bacterium]